MSNEPNKPIPAQELTEKELEGVVGGVLKPKTEDEFKMADSSMADDQYIVGGYFGHISVGVQVGK